MEHQQQNAEGGFIGAKPADAKLLDGMTHFDTFPNWFSQTDLDYLVSQFKLSGKRGPYNRYRAQNLDWHELADLDGATIQQPAFFITGEFDPVSKFVPSTSFVEHVKKNYDNLIISRERECWTLDRGGGPQGSTRRLSSSWSVCTETRANPT